MLTPDQQKCQELADQLREIITSGRSDAALKYRSSDYDQVTFALQLHRLELLTLFSNVIGSDYGLGRVRDTYNDLLRSGFADPVPMITIEKLAICHALEQEAYKDRKFQINLFEVARLAMMSSPSGAALIFQRVTELGITDLDFLRNLVESTKNIEPSLLDGVL